MAIKKIKRTVENAENYSNYKNRNINNIKSKLNKYQRNKINLDSFDSDFNKKLWTDLNLTQSLILPKRIRNQGKINNSKKIKKNLPPGNVSDTRMYQQYMEQLLKKI